MNGVTVEHTYLFNNSKKFIDEKWYLFTKQIYSTQLILFYYFIQF